MADIENRFPTIEANWDHFEKVDIAPTAPQIQRDEMKRAFYAGASSGMLLTVIAHNGKTLQEALQEVAKLNAELMAYAALRKAARRGPQQDRPA